MTSAGPIWLVPVIDEDEPCNGCCARTEHTVKKHCIEIHCSENGYIGIEATEESFDAYLSAAVTMKLLAP